LYPGTPDEQSQRHPPQGDGRLPPFPSKRLNICDPSRRPLIPANIDSLKSGFSCLLPPPRFNAFHVSLAPLVGPGGLPLLSPPEGSLTLLYLRGWCLPGEEHRLPFRRYAPSALHRIWLQGQKTDPPPPPWVCSQGQKKASSSQFSIFHQAKLDRESSSIYSFDTLSF
jgi:hypothetical protein